MHVDEVFGLLSDHLPPALEDAGAVPIDQTRHWILVSDQSGVALTPDDDSGLEPHEILAGLRAGSGTHGAAYVTQDAADDLVAKAQVFNPWFEDVRTSRVIRDRGKVRIGPWQG